LASRYSIMTKPLLYDSHMHTPLCKHARGEPEEYAAVAEQRGLKGVIITCHNPGPKGWSPQIRMALDEFGNYLAMVERARQEWAGRVDVRLGLESDFMPDMEPWLEKLHAQADFNFILGSVHPHNRYYKERYFNGDALAYQWQYFEHLAVAAESGLFDCLAHPDLVKDVFPEQWDLSRLLDRVRQSLDRIARTGVAMELNTSGLHKRIKEFLPGAAILAEMQLRDIPVVLGSDAHQPDRVAADFDQALELLAEVGYDNISYFLNRQRQDVTLPAAQQSLATMSAGR